MQPGEGYRRRRTLVVGIGIVAFYGIESSGGSGDIAQSGKHY